MATHDRKTLGNHKDPTILCATIILRSGGSVGVQNRNPPVQFRSRRR